MRAILPLGLEANGRVHCFGLKVTPGLLPGNRYAWALSVRSYSLNSAFAMYCAVVLPASRLGSRGVRPARRRAASSHACPVAAVIHEGLLVRASTLPHAFIVASGSTGVDPTEQRRWVGG